MEFKNKGKDLKINLGDRNEPNWITVKEGETVDIPEELGLKNQLEKVEGSKKVEKEEAEELEKQSEKPKKKSKK